MPIDDSKKVFNELYSTYKAGLVRFAKSYLAENPLLAEDIVEDAFVRFWENRDRLKDSSHASGYIFKTVKNGCLNHLRTIYRTERIMNTFSDPALWELEMRIASIQSDEIEKFFAKEIQSIVNDSIANLPERTRKIFCLKKLEGKRYAEIAKTIGVSLKTVEFHMSKALKRLRTALDDYLPK